MRKSIKSVKDGYTPFYTFSPFSLLACTAGQASSGLGGAGTKHAHDQKPVEQCGTQPPSPDPSTPSPPPRPLGPRPPTPCYDSSRRHCLCDTLLKECEVKRLRQSRPGGQRRNKVETAVALTHRPTGTTAQRNERRSQAENLAEAIFRLRISIGFKRSESGRRGSAAEHPFRQTRTARGKIAVSESHDDFPTIFGGSVGLDRCFSGGCETGGGKTSAVRRLATRQVFEKRARRNANGYFVAEENGLRRLQ